ncbi:ferric reductase-like transmembrane domain-containing protein [Paracoccus gahaiensis]|uniref:ferric reductase-like transmembrane domain-containing protein n=1 Tax=Paracoccus gahaiensis TaxID=1706839 RepID=UPI001FE47A49|nr:ferric reductase-like transmembrane domain-containing protein [Paracoccus gahaiensis]
MPSTKVARARAGLVWAGLLVALIVPVLAAAASPLLAWRDPVYILAGLAGVLGLALLLVQPLLAGGMLPGVSLARSRRAHRWIGGGLVAAVVIHVAALWITSPPDVVDALLFRSPTSFSVWGVIAMWAVFAAALLAASRRRLRLRPSTWRRAHTALAAVIVLGTVLHALLIQGTMETVSKILLCALVVAATARVVAGRRTPTRRPR